jgi:hypothetical protein
MTILLVALGVFLGLLAFATIRYWLPIVGAVGLLLLHVGIPLILGLPWWSLLALDGVGVVGLIGLGYWLEAHP